MRMAIPLTLILALGIPSAASPTPILGPGSSWAEIRNTPNVYARPPMIFFGTTGIPVTDLCLVGDKLRAAHRDGETAEVSATIHPLIYDIQIVEPSSGGERSRERLLFLKHFEIPACT
jgi:hypothetical protein